MADDDNPEWVAILIDFYECERERRERVCAVREFVEWMKKAQKAVNG